MAGAATPALRALVDAGIDHEVRTYDPGSLSEDDGADVARALGLDPAAVAKTLITAIDDDLVVAVVPVLDRIDLKALAAAAGGKRAQLAERAAAERAAGSVRGAISPLGLRRRLPTVVHDGLLVLERVWVSGGRRGLEVGLTPDALVRCTDATVADITTVAPRPT